MKTLDIRRLSFFEERERLNMKSFYELYLKPKFDLHFNSSLYLSKTHAEGGRNNNHDCVLYLRNKQTDAIEYKFIIEIKCRHTDYDTVLLEKKKYNGLLKTYKRANAIKAPNEELGILYIVFTDKKTIVFNLESENILTHLKTRKNLIKEKQPKTTFIGDDEEITKTLWYLPSTLGKKYDYRTI